MIVNRQRSVRVPMSDLRKFESRARALLRLPAESFTVCLVTSAEIARWNKAYRGKPVPTDVLSFPVESATKPSGKHRAREIRPARGKRKIFPVATAAPDVYLGDIAIAPAIARRNARSLDRTFNDEMRILILHGMLHLMGYDHETDTGQMDRRENLLRRKLGLA